MRRLPERYSPVRLGARLDRVGGSVEDDLAAVRPAPGPKSTTWSAARIVSSSCSTTMTLLPEIAQTPERGDESRVVARVEADARLVEHVHDSRELAPELAREADALRLAAAQRRPRPLEREVVETDVEQEAEAAQDLAKRALADRALRRAERKAAEREPRPRRPSSRSPRRCSCRRRGPRGSRRAGACRRRRRRSARA